MLKYARFHHIIEGKIFRSKALFKHGRGIDPQSINLQVSLISTTTKKLLHKGLRLISCKRYKISLTIKNTLKGIVFTMKTLFETSSVIGYTCIMLKHRKRTFFHSFLSKKAINVSVYKTSRVCTNRTFH